MHFPRAGLFAALVLAAILPATGPASAQAAWPSRPIRLIVPFPAGGASDVMARLVAAQLAQSLGQPLVIENRGGAGGNIGSDVCAKAPPDGQTLCMGTISSHAINAAVYPRMPYDGVRDFAPVALLGAQANVVVVADAVPARTVAELVALMRARPGAIDYGSPGNGTSAHLAGELFAQTAQATAVHVPYRGSSQLLVDLQSGILAVGFDNFSSMAPAIREGRIRALGVGSPARLRHFEDLPTIAETLPGFLSVSWSGLFAPAGTPAAVVDRLNQEVTRAVQTEAVRSRFDELGITPSALSPAEFGAFVAEETRRWGEVARRANIRAD